MATAFKTLDAFEHSSEEVLSVLPSDLVTLLDIQPESSVEELAKKADATLSAQQKVTSSEVSEESLRLAWLFAQIKLRQLPASALCSTLIELSPYLENNSEMALLAEASYAELSKVLEEKWQKRLAIGVLEEAVKVIEKPDFLRASFKKLDELLVEELSSLEDRRAPMSERTTLEQKQKEYQKKLKELNKSETISSSSGFVLANKDTEADTRETEEQAQYDSPSVKEGIPLPRIALILCALALCAFAAHRYLNQQSTLGPKLELAIPSSALSPKQEMLFPGLLPAKAKATDRFALATKRLTKLLKKEKTSEETEVENDTTSGAEPGEADAYPTQEIVSIEPSNPESSQIPENKVPALDPAALAGTKIEPVGSSGKKAPIPKEALRQGVRIQNDGRIYGRGAGADKSGGRKSLDGSTLRSYPVKKFDPPLTYRTVTRTKVASAPSILSHTLAELGPETPVYVSARMGRWLEVVSSNGGVGYIFAQDAREIRN